MSPFRPLRLTPLLLVLNTCVAPRDPASNASGSPTFTDTLASTTPDGQPYIVILGNSQDGGFPQAGTRPGAAWDPARRRFATSLAIVDPLSKERWLIEATPDFRDQLHELDRIAPATGTPGLNGIFITHAHIGHYTGLMHLGREVIGASGVPVYAMPRLREFLSSNGPWNQLVTLKNIELRALSADAQVHLNSRISITPFVVPHRDEYSETVGFRITGPQRTILFLPDIDKWERWDALGRRVESVVQSVDVAYIDATFYRDGEVPGRAMAEIPHPFIEETMRRFASASTAERAKIRFIHMNRTNPVALAGSAERAEVERNGYRIAEMREIVPF